MFYLARFHFVARPLPPGLLSHLSPHFQDCYLHYYLDADEPLPRATLDLTGCNVVTNKSLIVDGVEYFPFTISHPRSKLVYNLSSDSKLDADIWVAKILEAATANTFTTATTIEQASSNKEDEAVRAAPGGYAVTKQVRIALFLCVCA